MSAIGNLPSVDHVKVSREVVTEPGHGFSIE